MLFFLSWDAQGEIKLLPAPWGATKPGASKLRYLRSGLPLLYWQSILPTIPAGASPADICAWLGRRGSLSGFDWAWQEEEREQQEQEKLARAEGKVAEHIQAGFQEFVLGKQLTEQELRRVAEGLEVDQDTIIHLAARRVEAGLGEWVPAVAKAGRGWRCQRCGETNIEEWPSVYGPAATCLTCKSLGASTSLNALYRDKAGSGGRTQAGVRAGDVQSTPVYNLTPAQEQASTRVLEFIEQDKNRVALLWAACGAGKTEVCFAGIAGALRNGETVLYAAPRQDVIFDVAPRLQANFSNLKVQILTGATPFVQTGQLVLATTHQVLRFYQFFDLVILDEMDAFPYHGNRALSWGITQAGRPGGKVLYLTATPGNEELAEARNNRCLIRLPARHHRQPIPVPVFNKFKFSAPWADDRECPKPLAEWLKNLVDSGPTLLFVPVVSWVTPWVKLLHQTFPSWQIDGSYSADPNRRFKIEELSKGKYQVFVSTSILERGITIARAQVIVLGADHRLFDERALVQMAGRVGRTSDNPTGTVLFLGAQLTSSIKTAINWVKEQNSEANQLGLLD